jgi:hypothetical protein
MPGRITYEQFSAATPGYVERAHELATLIIDRALSDQESGVLVQGYAPNVVPPAYGERVTDLGRLVGLRDRQELRSIEVDAAAMEGSRLGLQYYYETARNLRVWAYIPPSPPLLRDRNDERKRQRIDWLTSNPRRNLACLAMPGYVFIAGRATGTLDDRPAICTYVYTQANLEDNAHTFHGSDGINNGLPENFRDALAPGCTEADKALLAQNVQTYHAVKIGGLLALMELVAHPNKAT